MMAKALEANGARVYIIGRRAEVLERAAKEHSVRPYPSQITSGQTRRQRSSQHQVALPDIEKRLKSRHLDA